jgi:hypothetical protein
MILLINTYILYMPYYINKYDTPSKLPLVVLLNVIIASPSMQRNCILAHSLRTCYTTSFCECMRIVSTLTVHCFSYSFLFSVCKMCGSVPVTSGSLSASSRPSPLKPSASISGNCAFIGMHQCHTPDYH